MTTILIGGDVCPIGRNQDLFREGNAARIFNGLLGEFETSDFTIVNLECPLVEKKSPIKKNGPTLGVESACINGLTNAGIDAVTLANNHIMDHGEGGLRNTLRVCQEAGLRTVGAGENIQEARKLLIVELSSKKIAFLGVTENEFSIADRHSPGANPLDLSDLARRVKDGRKYHDFIIVLYHGGKEMYEYPSPQLANTCRFLIEAGADAVIVQHTHCPGTVEKYLQGHIVYGQGNLIFDKKNSHPSFKQGFLVKLILSGNMKSELKILPYVQSNESPGVRTMTAEEEERFTNAFRQRSEQIAQQEFIEEQWVSFCEEKRRAYFNRIFGVNPIVQKLNSYKWFRKLYYSNNFMLRLENTISCESHRELLLTLLKKDLL